jgi:hypothetical protein
VSGGKFCGHVEKQALQIEVGYRQLRHSVRVADAGQSFRQCRIRTGRGLAEG